MQRICSRSHLKCTSRFITLAIIKLIFSISFLCLFFSCKKGQQWDNTVVSGRILDFKTGQPIPRANVSLLVSQCPTVDTTILCHPFLIESTLSDGDGVFKFKYRAYRDSYEKARHTYRTYKYYVHANADKYADSDALSNPIPNKQTSNINILLHGYYFYKITVFQQVETSCKVYHSLNHFLEDSYGVGTYSVIEGKLFDSSCYVYWSLKGVNFYKELKGNYLSEVEYAIVF